MEIPAELLARIAQEASLECRAKDAYIEYLSRDLAEVTRQRDELLRQLEELTAPESAAGGEPEEREASPVTLGESL